MALRVDALTLIFWAWTYSCKDKLGILLQPGAHAAYCVFHLSFLLDSFQKERGR